MTTTNSRTKTGNKGGRPTKYRREYCAAIKAYMGKGFSVTAFAGVAGVHRETLYKWEREIPEFSNAIKIARCKRVAKLEFDLLSPNSSAAVVRSRIIALRNACPAEWRKKITHEIPKRVNVPIEEDATRIYREVIAMLDSRTP